MAHCIQMVLFGAVPLCNLLIASVASCVSLWQDMARPWAKGWQLDWKTIICSTVLLHPPLAFCLRVLMCENGRAVCWPISRDSLEGNIYIQTHMNPLLVGYCAGSWPSQNSPSPMEVGLESKPSEAWKSALKGQNGSMNVFSYSPGKVLQNA